jgi:hypothetical protein
MPMAKGLLAILPTFPTSASAIYLSLWRQVVDISNFSGK